MTELDLCQVRIRSRRREVNGIVSLQLEPCEGEHLPAFSAGAHIDLLLPSGTIRQYSLCSDPEQHSSYRIAVLLDPQSRGGSREVHSLAVGQELSIGKPRNHFPLADNHDSAVLVAGGIGVTPMLAMAQTLHRQSVPFTFHYLTRSRSSTAFRKELRSSAFSDHVHLRHDDQQGVADSAGLAELIGEPREDRHLYVCGPQPLIGATVEAAQATRWSDEFIHFEHFKAPNDPVDGDPVTLRLERSGKTVEVPGDCTLAKALANEGINVPVACEQGICGTCVVSVLDGTPDHRDTFLREEERKEGKRMALCCSRSLTPSLTLDL
ncbi:PDR/VanB family oxidoreductase [Erythrobacter sp. AP23]|uniref:PDR/VanB family oxidoreductase n=1 Tax=Erythrobacter sp. AP23 TaxID=499656 RepID=UPI0009FA9243|nr:PDR/VanB family oxidoreductase [Erythrobacter sp. AP23]